LTALKHFAGTQGKKRSSPTSKAGWLEMFTDKVNASKNVIMMDDVKALLQ
jgi:hypothetical protein